MNLAMLGCGSSKGAGMYSARRSLTAALNFSICVESFVRL